MDLKDNPDLQKFAPPKFIPPSNAEIFKDIQYSTQPGHIRQRLDLYLPKPENRRPNQQRIPLIVYVHGGAFMFGSKESPLMPARLLAKGIALASLDYRLSGDALFPAAVQDCKAALRHIRAHLAGPHNLDTDRLVVWGESAGAHMATMLGVLCASPSADEEGEEFDVGDDLDQFSSVAGVVGYYGPSDFLLMDSQAIQDGRSFPHDGVDSPESKYIGEAIQTAPAKTARANPITYLKAEEGVKPPPFFLAHGVLDHVVPYGQSVVLYEALKKVGAPVVMHSVQADHVWIGASKEEMDELDRVTDEFLKGIFG